MAGHLQLMKVPVVLAGRQGGSLVADGDIDFAGFSVEFKRNGRRLVGVSRQAVKGRNGLRRRGGFDGVRLFLAEFAKLGGNPGVRRLRPLLPSLIRNCGE